jgi:hypothetical protein
LLKLQSLLLKLHLHLLSLRFELQFTQLNLPQSYGLRRCAWITSGGSMLLLEDMSGQMSLQLLTVKPSDNLSLVTNPNQLGFNSIRGHFINAISLFSGKFIHGGRGTDSE